MAKIKRNGWTLDDDFYKLERGIAGAADRAVDTTALAVVRTAKKDAPVDRGALQASGYVVSPLRDDYAAAVTAAKAANPKVELESEITHQSVGAVGLAGRATPENLGDDVSAAVVAFPVRYASFLEEGHYSSFIGTYQRPQPFFNPAFEAHEDDLGQNAAKELRKIGITAQIS